MSDAFSSILLVGSSFFAFVAGLGLLRFADLPSRMHAATKASGAAFALILLAMCLRVPELGVIVKSIVALGFAFLTLPVAAHLLGRSSMGKQPPATDAEPAEPAPPAADRNA
jgi:multicomponent Na+:H+ antiporter subunit G